MPRPTVLALIVLIAACGDDLQEPTTVTLELTAATFGEPADPDGYTAQVDGSHTTVLGVNATAVVADLSPGEHEVALGGIAPNCLLDGPNPRTVSAGAGDVIPVRFDVRCSTPPGGLEVAVTTSGESPDPDGYEVSLDAGAAVAVATSGSVTYSNLSAGEHEVRFSGLAPNCVMTGDNPRRVTIGFELVRLDLEIRCGPPTGTVRVVTTTGGPRPDADGYNVRVAATTLPIGSNASLTVPGVLVGGILVELTGVATNCQVEGDNPRTVPLANGELVEVGFAVTCQPNGEGILLFTSDRSGSNHLYRVRDDGTELRDLTPSFEVARGDWSPDGLRIVFTVAGANGSELFLMNADGSEPEPLGVSGGAPKWSPDSRKIVYTGNGIIKVTNADGTGVKQLAEGYEPAWSPDGTRIAFGRVDRTRCVPYLFCPTDLYVMNADGSHAGRLVAAANSSDDLGSPAWSPDGSSIAYTRSCCFLGPDEGGVYVVQLGEALPRQIYQGRTGGGPVWSPDGSGLAIGSVRADGTTDVMVIPAGGGSGSLLAVSPANERPQAWR